MIKRALSLIFLLLAAVAAAAQSAPTQTATPQKPATPPPAPHTNLKVGDKAPDFNLPSTIVQDGKRMRYKLSDFKGKKNVVLAVYVFAFTGGWTKEMKAYQADIAKFEANDTQVFGLSVDSPFANAEFAKQIGVTFPILSDIKHTTVKDYGIYNEEGGYGNRATFVIDKDGIIQNITEGNGAIDPTSAEEACNLLTHKKTTQ